MSKGVAGRGGVGVVEGWIGDAGGLPDDGEGDVAPVDGGGVDVDDVRIDLPAEILGCDGDDDIVAGGNKVALSFECVGVKSLDDVG